MTASSGNPMTRDYVYPCRQWGNGARQQRHKGRDRSVPVSVFVREVFFGYTFYQDIINFRGMILPRDIVHFLRVTLIVLVNDLQKRKICSIVKRILMAPALFKHCRFCRRQLLLMDGISINV